VQKLDQEAWCADRASRTSERPGQSIRILLFVHFNYWTTAAKPVGGFGLLLAVPNS
jgi:hypothetical protein